MSSPLNLSLNIEWHETESDNSKCVLCDTLIIGKMFQQVVFVDFEPVYTKEKVCEYCYNDGPGEK